MVKVNIPTRALYTILAIIIIVLAGVVVWAVAPNPGHSWTDIDVPSDLADGDDVCSTSGACTQVCIDSNCIDSTGTTLTYTGDLDLSGVITNSDGNVVIQLG